MQLKLLVRTLFFSFLYFKHFNIYEYMIMEKIKKTLTLLFDRISKGLLLQLMSRILISPGSVQKFTCHMANNLLPRNKQFHLKNIIKTNSILMV